MSLRAAFEDILADENLINPVSDMTETEINEVLEEVQESENEVVKTQEMVEILEEESTALEALITSAESSDGGMTRREAALYTHAVESICRRVYIPSESVSMPALESFGGSGDRLTATLEAAEDGRGLLKRMWDALLKGLRAMYDGFINFFKKIFGGADAIGKSLDNTSKELAVLPKDEEIELVPAELVDEETAETITNGAQLVAAVSKEAKVAIAASTADTKERTKALALAKGHSDEKPLTIEDGEIIQLPNDGGTLKLEDGSYKKKKSTRAQKKAAKKESAIKTVMVTNSQAVTIVQEANAVVEHTKKDAKVKLKLVEDADKFVKENEKKSLANKDSSAGKSTLDNTRRLTGVVSSNVQTTTAAGLNFGKDTARALQKGVNKGKRGKGGKAGY